MNRIVQDIAAAIEAGNLPETSTDNGTVWHRADDRKLE